MEILEMLPDQPAIDASQAKGLWIPGEILHDHDLTPQEKMLASLIWHMDQMPHHCYASNRWFSRQMALSERTIVNMISSLRKKGVIKQLAWNGKFRVMTYIR